MKKIVLIQNDDGTLELDGQPVESPEDALEQIKMSVMPVDGGEMPGEEIAPEGEIPEDVDTPEGVEIAPEGIEEEPMEGDDIGKTLGSKLPKIDKAKMGMRPKKKASFEDYGL